MSLTSFLSSWQLVLFFYIATGFLLYLNRSKFDFQGIIALYRTKFGLKAMKSLAEKHRKLIIWLGYIGIIVGYLGMALIVFFIFQGMYNLLFLPGAPATISPVLPGVKIPGSPIFVPFWHGILSLFVVIVIHEFSHGVVSKAHKVPVKSSGFVLFGPLPGAFVEPDEKILAKKKPAVQNSIYAAGPFSNVLTALFIIALFGLVIGPAVENFDQSGVSFKSVTDGFPASEAGVLPGVTYNHVNGELVSNNYEFFQALSDLKEGDTVTISNADLSHEIVATSHPDKEEAGYVGVIGPKTVFANEGKIWFSLFLVFVEFLNWVFMLSLGLGLANLLPLGPVDGGRMFRIACHKFFGEKKGDVVWVKTSYVFFVTILILVFIPILKAVF